MAALVEGEDGQQLGLAAFGFGGFSLSAVLWSRQARLTLYSTVDG